MKRTGLALETALRQQQTEAKKGPLPPPPPPPPPTPPPTADGTERTEGVSVHPL